MLNDSEFGDVECALKREKELYTDDDYIKVMKNCRVKNKFEVRRLNSQDFLSSKKLEDATTNRKVDVNKQKISWLGTNSIISV